MNFPTLPPIIDPKSSPIHQHPTQDNSHMLRPIPGDSVIKKGKTIILLRGNIGTPKTAFIEQYKANNPSKKVLVVSNNDLIRMLMGGNDYDESFKSLFHSLEGQLITFSIMAADVVFVRRVLPKAQDVTRVARICQPLAESLQIKDFGKDVTDEELLMARENHLNSDVNLSVSMDEWKSIRDSFTDSWENIDSIIKLFKITQL